jgi:hypothetical protein
VHGVLLPGAQVTPKAAVTFAVPGPTAWNTAVAILPENRYAPPRRTALSEMVGGEGLHLPYPLQPPVEMNVTVSVEPNRTQSDDPLPAPSV